MCRACFGRYMWVSRNTTVRYGMWVSRNTTVRYGRLTQAAFKAQVFSEAPNVQGVFRPLHVGVQEHYSKVRHVGVQEHYSKVR